MSAANISSHMSRISNDPHAQQDTPIRFSGEWETFVLGEHVTFLRNGVNSRAELEEEGTLKYLHYGDIHTSSHIRLDLRITLMPNLPVDRAQTLDRLQDGDLVLVDASEDLEGVGKSVEISGVADTEIVSGLHTIAARFDKTVLADSFKAYLQFCPTFRDHLKRLAAGTKVLATKQSHIASVQISLPSIQEQIAIAEALSDVDGLIRSLETLIAKKRAIKQAAMQELLTGKTRLPGFSRRWETKRLSEIASIRNEKVMPSTVGIETPCVELDHIGQGNGRLLECSTAQHSISSKYRFFSGDVLFGRLRSYLRKFWHADRDGICTTEIWPLMTDSQQADSGFLHEIVQSDRFIEAASISYGTHMPRADWKVMRNFEVRLPQVREQRAIATVLSDMDAEIAALERRRDKTRAIKQGMMQQLLTGRVRLVQPEVTAAKQTASP